MGDQRATPGLAHREGTFRGAGGCEIYWQAWRDEGAATRAAIVLVHGAAEHSGRYRYVVERLVPDGFPIWALDHRGHGRSEGRRSMIDRVENAVADIDTLVERVRSEEAGAPLVMLGHSMGGALGLSYTFEHQEKLDALVLSAPAAALETASGPIRVVSDVLSALVPWLPVYDVDPSTISRDPAEVAAYESDSLNHHGRLPARTVAEIAAAIRSFPVRLAGVRLPLLVMHGGADAITPASASEMVYEHAGSPDKTLKIYDGLYHEIFNEAKADRERVLDDLAGWLAAPSG